MEVTHFWQAPVAWVHHGLKKFQQIWILHEILHKICPRYYSTRKWVSKNITLKYTYLSSLSNIPHPMILLPWQNCLPRVGSDFWHFHKQIWWLSHWATTSWFECQLLWPLKNTQVLLSLLTNMGLNLIDILQSLLNFVKKLVITKRPQNVYQNQSATLTDRILRRSQLNTTKWKKSTFLAEFQLHFYTHILSST